MTTSRQAAQELQHVLYEHDSFMESVGTLVDLGCGNGDDLVWWATATTRDNTPIPLNIQCTGVDIADQLPIAKKYSNIVYQKTNFEETIHTPQYKKFDILWCHDSFQYALNPLQTLIKWRDIAENNGMLLLTVPQTTNIRHRRLDVRQRSGVFFHYTLVNLIHLLVIAGWDIKGSYFKKDIANEWIYAAVYKSDREPLDPRTTWIDMLDKNLLPESAEQCIHDHEELLQEHLILPWLDGSLTWYHKH